MNRSRYVSRPVDSTDHAIIAILSKDGRVTIRDLAAEVGLSSPSVTERIHKLQDCGAIAGYTIRVDPNAFGLSISAYLRLRAVPGEVKRLAQMLVDTPAIVEADRVTGEDCFIAKVLVVNIQELEVVIDQFATIASTHSAVIQSSPVLKRLPKL
jgi:Lrp/AsnC family leucine-responsive transcriptional regulator